MTYNYPKCTPVVGRTVYLTLPDNFDLQNSTSLIEDLKQSLNTGNKVRIVFDNQDYEIDIIKILDVLKLEMSDLKFENYPTRFYQQTQTNLPNTFQKFPETDWQNYSENFEYVKVDSINSDMYSVLENFCMVSNGSTFSKNAEGRTVVTPDFKMQETIKELLPKAVLNHANHIYLVKEKLKNIFVGCFDLVEFSDELQLHYTSGKSNLPSHSLYSGKKMPILAGAIYNLFQTSFSSFERITFSSKDEATKKIYTEVGFEEFFGRSCILVKRSLDSVDLR